MHKAIVITPVKNAIETTIDTAEAISSSNVKIKHYIFNDFSDQETRETLENEKNRIGYELVHLEEITENPSPNYKLVLQIGQKMAIEENVPLIVVESDVLIRTNTISRLLEFLNQKNNVGLLGAVTVDEKGKVNFPYLKFKNIKVELIKTNRSLSFCCTVFSPEFLRSFDFIHLEDTKHWFDTFISKKSINLGFDNYLMMNNTVWHRPHGSRPWKQLKYKNPLKYYFLKFLEGWDKI